MIGRIVLLTTLLVTLVEAGMGDEPLEAGQELVVRMAEVPAGRSIEAVYATYHQGRYANAELLHKRALAIKEMALGPDHPKVAIGLINLADLKAVRRPLP